MSTNTIFKFLTLQRRPTGPASRRRPERRLLGLVALEDRVTPSWTQMVRDINVIPINPTSNLSSHPSQMVAIDSTTYFTADDGVHGEELWKSDGTAAGTELVKDINPGSTSSVIGELTNGNGTLFFTINDDTRGTELWKSDGTAAGTVFVKDIRTTFAPAPGNLTDVNGTLFFTRLDPTNGNELWKSDGTAAGTVLVSPAYAINLTNVNGTLFFSADDDTYGSELWKSDGTAAGTTLVKDIIPGSGGSGPSELTDVNGTLFFTTNEGTQGMELWKSDGTAADTVFVKSIPGIGHSYLGVDNLTNVNGTLFFSATDDTYGNELWKSDGTDAGTALVGDIIPGGGSSNPINLTDVNGTLFFTTEDITGDLNGLWKSDGTAAGTVLVSAGLYASGPMTDVNGKLFFIAYDSTHGYELWTSDGAAGGTTLVNDINPGNSWSSPGWLTNVNGELFFSADDGTHGQELWKLVDEEDVSLPMLNISNVTVVEGNNGTVAAFFTVCLSAAYYQSITVDFSIADGTAIAGSDYQPTYGTLTIPAGQTTGTITVLVNGDRLPEANETFSVNLSGATNAVIADGQGAGTIVDDEPLISISDVTKAEGKKNQTALFTFTVTLSVAYDQPVTMSFRTANGTATTNDGDYIAKTGTLTFAPGETSKTITIEVKGDSKKEADETFYVDLFGNSSNSLFTKSRGVGTNLNDD